MAECGDQGAIEILINTTLAQAVFSKLTQNRITLSEVVHHHS